VPEDSCRNDYLIDVWDSDRGLPQNSVTSLAQTPDGYLWVGTRQAGVARFDGVRFASFDPSNTPGLPQIEMRELMVDAQGALWLAMVGGWLSRYEAGRFVSEPGFPPSISAYLVALVSSRTDEVFFANNAGELFRGLRQSGTNSSWGKISLPNTGPITRYCASNDGRIWYIRDDLRLGCWRDGQVEPLQNYEGLPGHNISALARDPEGRVWVGTEQGLACFENGRFVDLTPTNSEPGVAVQDFAFTGEGGLWVRSEGRLRKCIGRQWIAEAKSLPPGLLTRSFDQVVMLGGCDGGVWVRNPYGGVWHVEPDGRLRALRDEDGLPTAQINCWLQDREGNIWLGLEGGGLARLRPRRFQVLKCPDPIAGTVMRSVCEDADGGIWLGGSDGRVFGRKKDAFQELVIPKAMLPVTDVTLWPDRQGGLWVGTVHNGVWLSKEDRMVQPFPGSAIGDVARVLFGDSQERMWIGNEHGLFCWSNGRLQHFGPEQGFVVANVKALAEDPGGALWIGTGNGLLWRYQNSRFSAFALPKFSPMFRFWSLLPDADGTVWVGTLGGGLLRWRDGKLARCTSTNGLYNDNISQLLADDRGHLWAGSRAGIFSVNRKQLNDFFDGWAPGVFCRTFGKSDGLPALECSSGYQPACWRAHDGRLWFTTVKGLVSVQPDEMEANPLPPAVLIEEMRVDGIAQDIRLGSPALTLSPGRHQVAFRYAGLSFSAPERVRFQYRLEGWDPNWVWVGTTRTADYNYLPPGHYTFSLRACNRDGIWNPTAAALSFRVLPHVWETWWFRLVAPVLTFGLAGGVIVRLLRRRHGLQLERVNQQHAMERERTRIAQDLHDDLGASLTQVVWLMEGISRPGISADEHQGLVTQITAKAREMARAIGEIVWAVNPKNDSLDQMVSYLCQYAEQYFRGTSIRCWTEVPELLPALPLSSDVRHNLFLAIKEALQNVAKHAGTSQVWVRIRVGAHGAEFVVEDNGSGFVPGEAVAGNGLDNMRQRAAACGMSFSLHSAPGQGTVINIRLPLAGTN